MKKGILAEKIGMTEDEFLNKKPRCTYGTKRGFYAGNKPYAANEYLLLVESFESLLELINTSACINKLLLAGEEGMALGANFNSNLASLCGLCNNGLAACALDYALFVLGLNSFFHFFLPHKIISLFFDSDFTSRVIISLFCGVVNRF